MTRGPAKGSGKSGGAAVGALGILLAVTTALILIPAGRAPVRLLSTALFVGALTWSVFPVLNPW
jgi:hypothetical protein